MRIPSVFVAAAVALFVPVSASACADGARCLEAPASSDPIFAPGDRLQPGSFNMLMNSEYHGLPRATAGSWYVTIDRRVLRIQSGSYEVIEDVTAQARRAF